MAKWLSWALVVAGRNPRNHGVLRHWDVIASSALRGSSLLVSSCPLVELEPDEQVRDHAHLVRRPVQYEPGRVSGVLITDHGDQRFVGQPWIPPRHGRVGVVVRMRIVLRRVYVTRTHMRRSKAEPSLQRTRHHHSSDC